MLTMFSFSLRPRPVAKGGGGQGPRPLRSSDGGDVLPNINTNKNSKIVKDFSKWASPRPLKKFLDMGLLRPCSSCLCCMQALPCCLHHATCTHDFSVHSSQVLPDVCTFLVGVQRTFLKCIYTICHHKQAGPQYPCRSIQ